MENKIPKIHIDPKTLESDFDMLLMSKYDIFFRRIVEYVLDKVEGSKSTDLLAILVDDEGEEYEMSLPPKGYKKSLTKANKYFEKIEEFETCDLIKQLKINDRFIFDPANLQNLSMVPIACFMDSISPKVTVISSACCTFFISSCKLISIIFC